MKILTNMLQKLSLSADIVDAADLSAKMSGVDAAIAGVRADADCISGQVSGVGARTESAHERIDELSAALSGTAGGVAVLSAGLSSVVQDVSAVSGMIDTGLSTRVYNLENLLSDCQELTPEDDVSALLEVVNKLISRLGGKNVPDMLMQTFEGIRYVLKSQVVKKPTLMVDTWTGEVSAYGDIVS